jgi:hypothetical protein
MSTALRINRKADFRFPQPVPNTEAGGRGRFLEIDSSMTVEIRIEETVVGSSF